MRVQALYVEIFTLWSFSDRPFLTELKRTYKSKDGRNPMRPLAENRRDRIVVMMTGQSDGITTIERSSGDGSDEDSERDNAF